MEFKKRYSALNSAQRQAVDMIDGPVMVIAGPGTGKTELLGVRAANILLKTDVLPENILCLTFTDNAADAMRDRLTSIIGKDAYKIAVHTFHSFGSEIINRYGQYFYQGAHFRPADEMSRYQIIREVFEELEHDNPINSQLNDDFTHLGDALRTISELKKSSLTGDELLAVLDANDAIIEKVEQLLSPVFETRINKDSGTELSKHLDILQKARVESPIDTIVPLADVLLSSLETALEQAESPKSTRPITAWNNKWFKKDETGKYILKSKDRQTKLRALSFVYERYMSRMQEMALYDFDDMILRTVHAMEVFDDLRFNLQEQYQYIMVDEFQDTNLAQMRILHNLTNNANTGFEPNILVVGDDDQAIYSFQGADISNIIDFRAHYPKAKLVTLTDNYRSHSDILGGSRALITQGENRLENHIAELSKELSAKGKILKGEVGLFEASSIDDERYFVVKDIQRRLKNGEKPGSIAVFTRRHKEISALLPYFAKHNIPVSYDRYDDALKTAPVQLLEKLALVLIDINQRRYDDASARLPELLADKAWNIDPIKLWKLSIQAYNERKQWLERMGEDKEFEPLHKWLIETATIIDTTPLETLFDIMIGTPQAEGSAPKKGFISPLYDYFFSSANLALEPDKYISYLEALRAIRNRLIEYRPDQTPTLHSFIDFINLSRKLGSGVNTTRQSSTKEAVNLMTAHSSKGLEFETVYILNVVDNVWGDGSRAHNRLIDYPENLPLKPAGENSDERLRLFYVAITRAKRNLTISYSLRNDTGKPTRCVAMLLNLKDSVWKPKIISPSEDLDQIQQIAELAWYQPVIEPVQEQGNILSPLVKDYKLSVTHLHNFLDVTRGGPAIFLLNNLLRFPKSKSPNAVYGTAIHDALHKAHSHLTANGERQAVEDVLGNFETSLRYQHLAPRDFELYLKRGSAALQEFLTERYKTFTATQKAELNFSYQQVVAENAHLTGKLDLVDIDEENKTISVTDYKTGRTAMSWKGRDEYEKIKLHKYRQQLLFYKLLIENSRDWGRYQAKSGFIEFVEPTKSKNIISLTIDFTSPDFATEELERFKQLLNAVWNKITTLDLPNTSNYEPSLKGILAFEQDLIDDKI